MIEFGEVVGIAMDPLTVKTMYRGPEEVNRCSFEYSCKTQYSAQTVSSNARAGSYVGASPKDGTSLAEAPRTARPLGCVHIACHRGQALCRAPC
jgi:hypothetical protein